MKKFKNIKVIKEGEGKAGLIVEVREGDPSKVVCREYFYREDKTLDVENEMYEIDMIPVISKRTLEEMKTELVTQIGTDDFYISEEVLKMMI